jgi:hypothetical protein
MHRPGFLSTRSPKIDPELSLRCGHSLGGWTQALGKGGHTAPLGRDRGKNQRTEAKKSNPKDAGTELNTGHIKVGTPTQ